MDRGFGMGRAGRLLGAAALWTLMGIGQAFAALDAADFGTHQPSVDASYVAQWVLQSDDHQGRPFVIVDKKDARVYVFESRGRLLGASPALLGQMLGDGIAPDVGDHTQAGNVPLAERTTPSGRFVSVPGTNLAGEHVVWIDYDAAFALHRLRPGAAREDREARLASTTPGDHRVSLGCVVVPEAFYTDVVQPLLGRKRGVVYVLPEESSVHETFNPL
jgi:hypothetical protein